MAGAGKEKMMVYQWKSGARYRVAADVAANVMNGLAEENRLSAKALVDISRPEDAPLHNEFEWNDGIAAEKWREQQGRVMIAMISVITDEAVQQEPVRAFFNIEKGQSNYEPISLIIKDADKTELLFRQAMSELKSFREKYKGLKEFQKLFHDIEEIEQQSFLKSKGA